jgi:type IV pilus assembly protein PilA
MKTMQKGFTLIELMIVVAIIGILAAVAIPAYQNYVIRGQVTEGLSLAAGWKTAVSEFYAQNGAFPTGTSVAGSPTTIAVANVAVGSSAGKYVSNVTVIAGGQIQIKYGGPSANAKIPATAILDITPGTDANGDVIWICGKAPVPATVVAGTYVADATSIVAAYLPTSCHA